jgi:hypothetical protein
VKSTEECGVCGKTLIYQPDPKMMQCIFCGKSQGTNIFCPQGHYVCDECHQKDALVNLKQVLEESTSTCPSAIFEAIAASHQVPMHGPEHHVIVPAVLVAAARNAGFAAPENALEQAITRGSKVPGGWCGFCGDCGAAVGVGIAVSCLTKATPLTGIPRTQAIRATAAALENMSDSYPRCCKRASRKAIETAVDYFAKELGINLDKGEQVKCQHVVRNQQCPKTGCVYYPAND